MYTYRAKSINNTRKNSIRKLCQMWAYIILITLEIIPSYISSDILEQTLILKHIVKVPNKLTNLLVDSLSDI